VNDREVKKEVTKAANSQSCRDEEFNAETKGLDIL
jgi:hypothetical protein